MTIQEYLKKYKLQEKFENYELEQFRQELESYPDLKDWLSLPLREVGGNYWYLLSEEDRETYQNKTLLEFMEGTYLSSSNFEMLISKENDKPLGWLAYIKFGHSIYNIKMFAFNGISGPTFMKDVKGKFQEFCRTMDIIEWTAELDNPFVKHYVKAILKYRGWVEKLEGKTLKFLIYRYNPCTNFSYLENIFSEEILQKAGYFLT